MNRKKAAALVSDAVNPCMWELDAVIETQQPALAVLSQVLRERVPPLTIGDTQMVQIYPILADMVHAGLLTVPDDWFELRASVIPDFPGLFEVWYTRVAKTDPQGARRFHAEAKKAQHLQEQKVIDTLRWGEKAAKHLEQFGYTQPEIGEMFRFVAFGAPMPARGAGPDGAKQHRLEEIRGLMTPVAFPRRSNLAAAVEAGEARHRRVQEISGMLREAASHSPSPAESGPLTPPALQATAFPLDAAARDASWGSEPMYAPQRRSRPRQRARPGRFLAAALVVLALGIGLWTQRHRLAGFSLKSATQNLLREGRRVLDRSSPRPPSPAAAPDAEQTRSAPHAVAGTRLHAQAGTSGMAMTGSDGANVRAAPAMTASVLQHIPAGVSLQTTGQVRSNGGHRWIGVRLADGQTGFVRDDKISQPSGPPE